MYAKKEELPPEKTGDNFKILWHYPIHDIPIRQ